MHNVVINIEWAGSEHGMPPSATLELYLPGAQSSLIQRVRKKKFTM